MSDFGSTLSATKASGGFTANEVNEVSQKLKEIIKNDDAYINYLGEPYKHDFHVVSNDSTEILVQLSEYYFGGDEDEDDDLLQTIEEEELDDAKELAQKLAALFPAYTFEAEVMTW